MIPVYIGHLWEMVLLHLGQAYLEDLQIQLIVRIQVYLPTKNYDPAVIRIAAVIAVILGILGKFGGLVSSIPSPVTGGISIVLYGMISSVGVRILVNSRLELLETAETL